jgi:hypothetical protein
MRSPTYVTDRPMSLAEFDRAIREIMEESRDEILLRLGRQDTARLFKQEDEL